MKKILYIALIAGIAVTGCTKPESRPLEYITEDYVFDPKDQNGFFAERFLNDIYSALPNGFNRIDGDFLDAATDDAVPSRDGREIEVFTKGLLSVTSGTDNVWAKYYGSIRKVNLFLAKIDIVPVPQKIPYWKAEARALRAMFYFELVKRYGGVPLVGDEVLDPGVNYNFKRNTFQECIEYIVGECDVLKDLVKPDRLVATDYGRISRGVVMALKTRALLYAASPLYNGGNIGESAEQKLYQGYSSYDAERWNRTAQAANDLIAEEKFQLEGTFTNVFLNRRNNEVILAFLENDNRNLENNNGPVGYTNPNVGNGRTSPTQELVDAYPMVDGRPITESSSYNPDNPYANRDPRFYRTVLTNGARWLQRNLETFEGGRDKPNVNTTQTRTSYYLRKFLGNFEEQSNYSNQKHNFPIFRYADILLTLAEARNEYLSAPDAGVYQVLRDIRRRAGIAAGSDNLYGLRANMSKGEMREAIRTERRLEFAFEEHRFWDLRRWKIAESELNKALHGMKIARGAGGGFSYERVEVSKINFSAPRMYFYPIPNDERLKNSNLIQNTGW